MLYIGLDIHSKHSTFEAINPETGEIISGYRIANEELVERIRLLGGAKRVVLEAGRTSWDWQRRLSIVADEVWVVSPQQVRKLLEGEAKTDRRDARGLAELTIKGLLKPIWVADEACMALRTLTRARGRLIKQSTASKNAVRGLTALFGQPCPHSDLTGVGARKFLDQLELPTSVHDVIAKCRELIDWLDKEGKKLEKQIVVMLKDNVIWVFLQTIPGVGPLIAATFVAEMGTIERFANPDALTRYSGLDPSTTGSSDRLHHGPILKHGNPYLRTAAVLAAQQQRNTKKDSKLRRNYWRMVLGRRADPNVAKVDTARRILKAVFYVWTKKEPYRDSILTG